MLGVDGSPTPFLNPTGAMGIPARIREPLLLARTNEKSRFFRLPSDSDAFVADFMTKQCGAMNKINSRIKKSKIPFFFKKNRLSGFSYIFSRLIIEQNATKKGKTPKVTDDLLNLTI